MENEAMETIEMLYSMISEARRMPLAADKVIVERDAILGMLEELRDSLPVEISEAKRLLSAKDEFISNAKREAEQIRKTAEDKARALVEEEEIVKIAKIYGEELDDAEQDLGVDYQDIVTMQMRAAMGLTN